MNFDLSSDQKMLVDTAANFAKKSSPVTRARGLRDDLLGFEPKVWRQMAELGWLGLCMPEDVGGFGGNFVDLALVLEQLGKTLVPEPILASVVLGGMSLARVASPEQCGRWLSPLCEGELHIALASGEASSRYQSDYCETRAEKTADGYSIKGRKLWVPGGHVAGLFVVSARTSGEPGDADGISLFAVDRETSGVSVQALNTMDGRRSAHVEFDGAFVGADRLLGQEGAQAPSVEAAVDVARAAACAESVGICQAVLDMTLEYMKTREQFGTKIGAFQALQHRAVEMFVETELVRSHAIEAWLRVEYGDEQERQAAISAAMVQVNTGGRFVVRQGIQLHGGIGCTDEHDIGLFFKRLQVLGHVFGDDAYHLHRFAQLTQPEQVAI